MDKYLSEAKKKVLTLTVSKQWFDMIVVGEKTEEYREIKKYWIKRLTTNCEVAYDVAAERLMPRQVAWYRVFCY